jgi:acetoin utilization deacetylase AcuC-like enzyme
VGDQRYDDCEGSHPVHLVYPGLLDTPQGALAILEFVVARRYLPYVDAISRTAWAYSPEFLKHNADLLHPERPERLTAILSRCGENGLLERLSPLDFGPASDDELSLAHTRRHIANLAKSGGRQLDPDTFCGFDTPEIARLAAGAAVAATRRVMAGEAGNAFCALRPPGHHAPADRAMGFCFLNNIAVAAAGVVANNPDLKVLILDWDVHHGNGTQAIFYESEKVLYSSVHQYPFYPGTGAASEVGRGPGKGLTINKPLAAGVGDSEFLDAISAILDESTALMRPDLVMISAGFDAHRDDPLANLDVSVEGFVEATRRICAFANAQCGGRIVSILEGGYNVQALADSVAAHVTVLMDNS